MIAAHLERAVLAADLAGLQGLDDEQWQDLGELVVAEGLEGLLYHRCTSEGVEVPAEVYYTWRTGYWAWATDNFAALQALKPVLSALAHNLALTVDFKRITSHGDLSQNVVLSNNDIVFVPRSFMGDVNDVITKIEPLLNVLLIPATYRDLYTTGGGLRVDTGEPAVSSTTQGFTRPLPGVGKLVVPPVEEEEEGEEQDGDGEQEE